METYGQIKDLDFRNRPDLFNPVPADMTGLVARATTRLSVIRALDRLDRFTLQVLDALAHLGDPAELSAVQGSKRGPRR